MAKEPKKSREKYSLNLSYFNIINFKTNDLKFPKFFKYNPQHSHPSILLKLLFNTEVIHNTIILHIRKKT